jgi:hypothetical protein
MKTDVTLIDRWPQDVTLNIDVHYERGAPDRRTYSLGPARCASEVRVLIPQHTGKPLEMQCVRWSQWLACALHVRCFNVLAVHWFGDVSMPPRVQGAPLWQRISASFSTDDLAMSLEFRLEVVEGMRAALHYRFGKNPLPVRRAVVLDLLDADPLRAFLRVGARHVRAPLIPHASAGGTGSSLRSVAPQRDVALSA